MLKEFSKYTISNVLIKGASFIIPLVLAYYYTQEEYGIISLGYAYLNFFSMFFAFGFCESVQRYYFELRDTNKKEIFGNILLFNLFLVLGVSLLFLVLCFFTNIFKEVPKSIFIMVLFIGYMKALQNIGLSFLQMERLSSKYVTVSMFSVFFDIILIVLFVVIIKFPVEFRFVSLVICNFISAVLILIFIKKYIRKPISLFPSKFIEILKFAFPCMLLPIMSWLLTTSDKVVMSKLGTMSNLGVYSFCFSISQIPAIIQQGFNTAYTPIFFKDYENRNKIKNIQTVFIKFYALILLIFVLCVYIFFKYIKIFEKYETGLIYIPLFVFSMFFSAISSMNNSHLAYSYKTKITLLITSITGPLTIILNYIFIKNYDSLGAAISVVVSMTIQMFLSFIFSLKYGYFAWKLRSLISTLFLLCVGLIFSKNIIVLIVTIIFFLIYFILSEREFIKCYIGNQNVKNIRNTNL